MSNQTYPLGRREAVDERDNKFPMALVLPTSLEGVTSKYWYAYRAYCNQTGDTCVANAWTHFLTDSPRTHRIYDLDAGRPNWGINLQLALRGYVSNQSSEAGWRGWLYDQAQNIDEWDDTPPEGGTSVRAAAKILQALGAITSYHWANSVGDIANAVLTTGPVVMGTTWYNSMFNPILKSDHAYLGVNPDSGIAGGHAWVVNGYSTDTGYFRMKNSWGKDWGYGAHAYLSSHDLDYLLNDGGEACIGLEP